MKFFYTVSANDTNNYQTKDQILWTKPLFVAYQHPNAHVNAKTNTNQWIKFDHDQFEKTKIILAKYDFIPSFFQTINHDQINEYDGDELLGNPSDQTPIQTFENQTGETITAIQFNHRIYTNQKLLLDRNGLIGYSHVDIKTLKKIWTPIIRRIMDEA